MGNNPSQPTGHYQVGPQYQAPSTHFNRGYTMRETEHFRGGYTLRDPPKKKKMGLIGVPEYSPPSHSRYSQGSDLGVAAARAAFSQPSSAAAPIAWTPPQSKKHFRHGHSLRDTPNVSFTYPEPSSAAAPTPWTPPQSKKHLKHGHSLRNPPNVSFTNPEPSHFRSRVAPQQTFSQPAHQPFSHGYSLREPAKKPNHRRSKKSFW
ncbi:hypothetical protein FANTH_4661 [Fusarium anthophilum]|uniref:Uncharacterized protein n=1 Tax=Fusarium anthophilum TaxID=48485 RepID=A0A8H4ZNV2_9HYPO|nr:hypothetical protein FANTH_4661 [Fusarium anthophilum]